MKIRNLILLTIILFVLSFSSVVSQSTQNIEEKERTAVDDTIKKLNTLFWDYHRKDPETGLSVALNAYHFSKNTKNQVLQSEVYYNLGVIYQSLDIYDSALLYIKKSIEIV